jgi:hypothetical protein
LEAKKAKRGMQGKKGRQAPLAKDQLLQQQEEEKTQLAQNHNGQSGCEEGSRVISDPRKQFSILKELRDDVNFKAFMRGFHDLKQASLGQERSEKLPPEDDFGNTEYKLKLANPSLDRVQHLTTQMKFRLQVLTTIS